MSRYGTFARRNFEPLVLSLQVVIDLLVVLSACVFGYWIGNQVQPDPAPQPWRVYQEFWALTAAVCLVTFHTFGMYSPVKSLLNVEEFKAIAKSTVVAFLLLFTLIVFLSPTGRTAESFPYTLLVPLHEHIDLRIPLERMSRVTLLLTFFLIYCLMTVNRFFAFKVIQEAYRRGIGHRNVLIYGDGESARWLQRKFLLVPTLGLRLVGLISAERSQVGKQLERSRVLGTLDDLDEIVREHKISEVFVASPESSEDDILEVIECIEKLGLTFRVVPRFYHLMTQRVRIENFHSIPLISRPERRISLLSAAAKRLLDILVAIVVLVVVSPLFVVAAILIRQESKGPVFFRQVRIGLDGKPFPMLKFRTMYMHLSGDAPKPSHAEDPRITRTGRLLRRYSLDELPQFLNVLMGNMSVVGPRPEMPFIVEKYGALERERLRAKPGITGLWQISFARQAAIHENIDYDIYYVENRSVLLDLVIIVLTCFAVVKGTGAH
jgi:exopolysaccharide biosynthesis polyprenyl glycosylphosphotransferase